MTTVSATLPEFQEDQPSLPDEAKGIAVRGDDGLLLDIDGYEGPMDVLLELARKQKVDLIQVSILQLVRQYLGFIEQAKALNLELAAEYLVMAAWLAYLKSRLLLPKQDDDEELSAEEMAEALQFQLRRLEAMRKVGADLMARPQLGQDVFARGTPEGLGLRTSMSMDAAMDRMVKMLGSLPKQGMRSVWTTLESFVPDDITDRLYRRSALASSFTAGLEMAKQGALEIKQDGLFRPIYMRATGEKHENVDVREDVGEQA
jgi:segregation and condensation protein A